MLGTSGINEIYFQHTFLREKKERRIINMGKIKKKTPYDYYVLSVMVSI